MVTKRNAETGGGEQRGKYCELEPIDTEIPQIKRHGGKREKESTDQERTSRPIDTLYRDAENQPRKVRRRVSGSFGSDGQE